MAKPKSYYVVYGNESFQRERYVRSAKDNFIKLGWEVIDCDSHAFSSFLYPDFLQPENLLIVVNTDKGDFDLSSFEEHLKNPDKGRCVLIHHKGGLNCKKPFKELVKKVGKKAIKFEQPSDWSYEKEMASFALKTAKSFGKEIPQNLALAIAKKVGPNFGSLFFEIKKACVLYDAVGSEGTLEPQHFKAFGSVSNSSFVDFRKALEERNLKATLKALKNLRSLYNQDPTMQITSGMQKRLLQLEQARNLRKRKFSDQNASSIMGVSPYVYKNLSPILKVWGDDLPKLISHFAKSQRNILSGSVNSWANFEVGLIRLLISQ